MHISASGRVGFNWLVDYINELQLQLVFSVLPKAGFHPLHQRRNQVMPKYYQVLPKYQQVLPEEAFHFPRVKTKY